MKNEDYNASLGLLVNAARKDAGLTVRELASRCGISAPTITRIEQGKGCLFSSVVEIAKALGYEASEFLSEAVQIEGYTKPPTSNRGVRN